MRGEVVPTHQYVGPYGKVFQRTAGDVDEELLFAHSGRLCRLPKRQLQSKNRTEITHVDDPRVGLLVAAGAADHRQLVRPYDTTMDGAVTGETVSISFS